MFNKNINFAKAEEEILKYWKDNECFKKGNELSKDRPLYTFYDGPPFATGLPHYGHILAGTIKDVICRYYYQKGYHIERQFGWDCHGLPVEYEIDKKLNIKTKEDVEKMGIANYNDECKKIVMLYSSEWEYFVERLGRWIEFEGSYKTMDLSFMESVWNIFSHLFHRNLIYRGFKIMPCSTACKTPLSNFEASQNYKDVSDPSVLVKFEVDDNEFLNRYNLNKCYLVAWTTTPWTLISNCGLAVNPKFTYSLFKSDKEEYLIIQSGRIESYFIGFEVIDTFLGEELIGMNYKPLFDHFISYKDRISNKEKHNQVGSFVNMMYDLDINNVSIKGRHDNEITVSKKSASFFSVLDADFVTNSDGTAIVQCSPAFGEEDYKLFLAKGLLEVDEVPPCPIDDNGVFYETKYKGMYFKDADKVILKDIKENILRSSHEVHSYPFCWRSDTPLMYKCVPNWFIKVQPIRDELLKNNDKINWMPAFVKYGRFHNWLANAKDWAISRNRYWGTPMPIWVAFKEVEGKEIYDYTDLICVNSIEELERMTGSKVDNLHKQYVDKLIISKNGKNYKRIPEVLDCWFESGSMPYAREHFPFSKNKDLVSKYDGYLEIDNHPADFIGEGIDQTRGWFYTLHVLSTLLFNKPAFKNVIVNGIVLAADGKKMSKRLKNYPSPTTIFDSYGADSLRFYLLSSPVVEGENLKFNETGVKEVIKLVLIPWYNTLSFFMECEMGSEPTFMDQWINDRFDSFNFNVSNSLNNYKLSDVHLFVNTFLDDLSNWYLRINRKELRLNGRSLGMILNKFSISMAPFIPFFSEYCYQSVKEVLLLENNQLASVHHNINEPTSKKSNEFDVVKELIEAIRSLREKHSIMLKRSLNLVTVLCKDYTLYKKYENIVKSECNVFRIEYLTDYEEKYKFKVIIRPFFKRLSQDKFIKEKIKFIKTLKEEDLSTIKPIKDSKEEEVCLEDLLITRDLIGVSHSGLFTGVNGDFCVILDVKETKEVKESTLARDFYSFVQKSRKTWGLVFSDKININIDNDEIIKVCKKYYPELEFTTSNKNLTLINENQYKEFDVRFYKKD